MVTGACHAPERRNGHTSERCRQQKYRTTPLRGMFTKAKGGFYHDGRFATMPDVVEHYDRHLKLKLDAKQKADLAAFVLSL